MSSSHATEDQAIAAEVCELLEERGIGCWIAPRDVAPGAKWDEAIVEAIQSSHSFLLILSVAANGSPYVSNEVNHAFGARKTIFTFRVEDVVPGKSLGFYLARHHWTDGFPPPLGKKVDALTAAISADVEAQGAAHGVGVATAVAAPVRKSSPLTKLYPRRRTLKASLPWIAATILALTTMFLARLQLVKPGSTGLAIARFVVPPPEKAVFGTGSFLAVSPDGQRLAFVAAVEGKRLLWMRSLDSPIAQALADTEDAQFPFWSPDSRFLGFFAQGRLKKLDVAAGHTLTLCAVASASGGSWNRDGLIVFSQSERGSSQLYRVSAVGGEATRLMTGDRARWPSFFPDGRHFSYSAPEGVFVGSIDSNETKHLLTVDSKVESVAPGYLLFVRERTLFAQPFDSRRLELTGEAVPIAEQVRGTVGTGAPAFSVSANGLLAYGADFVQMTRLTWFDRGGNQLGSFGPPGTYAHIELSPDDSQVAVEIFDSQTRLGDVWSVDPVRGTTSRLTMGPEWNYAPIWSPDGRRVVFTSRRTGEVELHERLASGAGQEDSVTKPSPFVMVPSDWSRDGRFIVYQRFAPKNTLWLQPLFGDRQAVPLLKSNFNEAHGRLSPDGRWLAYTSDESGKNQVYVQDFPPSGAKSPVSTGGGAYPRWRRDGRELFYLAADQKLMAVTVSADATFHTGEPKALFEMRGISLNPLRYPYAVTADGQRFLVNLPVGQDASSPITVVLNWDAGLKK